MMSLSEWLRSTISRSSTIARQWDIGSPSQKWARGYMTAAVKALIDEGFQQLELNRIQARVATGNYPSQAVCDRLGLKKEGVLRQAEWLYDHYVDLTMNSILRSEWKENPYRK
jgi:RimJ/RimL family protein N-acetyltransferase